MKSLQVGESVEITVASKVLWNETGIILDAKGRYDFMCDVPNEWWDWNNATDADGYSSNSWLLRATESLRRVPSFNWFRLVGAIDHDLSTAFSIGNSLSGFSATKSGVLQCFANDIPWMYWNNRGCVSLSITKTG